jgi:tetrahydromethanopterin S-methyltransferase subunit G
MTHNETRAIPNYKKPESNVSKEEFNTLLQRVEELEELVLNDKPKRTAKKQEA